MKVSIDIGTSYSSICFLGPEGKVIPVEIGTGTSIYGSKYSLPSAVFLEENGELLVGQAAMNKRKSKPQNFHMEFKRELGQNIPVILGDISFQVEDFYTVLFRYMGACVKKVRDEEIELAYLTYPAAYGQRKKECIVRAAQAAGLFHTELVDEPTAAAMSYCAEGMVKPGQTLLVYDFGGGTFDASLLRYDGRNFKVLVQPVGVERCGGVDIERLIFQDMVKSIDPNMMKQIQENQFYRLRMESQLAELAVKAKHHLSSASIFSEEIEIGFDLVPYQLTIERFNGMIASTVKQTIEACRQLLAQACIEPKQLSAVLLVGGTSRVPLVQQMVKQFVGAVPVLCSPDLELAVAQGALRYAEYRKNVDEKHCHMQAKPQQEEERQHNIASQETQNTKSSTYDRILDILFDGYDDVDNITFVKKNLTSDLITDQNNEKIYPITHLLQLFSFCSKPVGRTNEIAEMRKAAWEFLKGKPRCFFPESTSFVEKKSNIRRTFRIEYDPYLIYDPSFFGNFSYGFAMFPDCIVFRDNEVMKKVLFSKICISQIKVEYPYLILGPGLYMKVKHGDFSQRDIEALKLGIFLNKAIGWFTNNEI